ncbi:Calvin cycle protein CP12 [Monoraphidium neglectum]|uniref:Calvin cycle protein CP12 n=1 Tax=Monoraphidium neglectum TaxID=145388 RepID=A0A0D2MXZ8_9CHLO|nr:Calvin cycle protein CP12 [Monoraphidium neglectum]KIZ05217.1 Calvin cycle protein CP12 [Monoraphidium neglectum]|eukprot:XP_013904236.1 Calvin cycle protein CP12 [Monoraphidium neglectum]
MLTARPLATARPVRAARAVAARPSARVVRVRAQPEQASSLEAAIKEAEETCDGGPAGECAAAWDNVEEISAAISHKKDAAANSDPLEAFCGDNPDADECRVYED